MDTPLEVDGRSTESVREDALGALSWIDGYNDADQHGVQYKIVIEEAVLDGIVVRYEVSYTNPLSHLLPDRRFRISMQVDEIIED